MKKKEMTPLTQVMCEYIGKAYIAFRAANGRLAPRCPDYVEGILTGYLNRILDRDNCTTVYRDIWLDITIRSTLKKGTIYWVEDFSCFDKGEF